MSDQYKRNSIFDPEDKLSEIREFEAEKRSSRNTEKKLFLDLEKTNKKIKNKILDLEKSVKEHESYITNTLDEINKLKNHLEILNIYKE